MIPSAFVMLDSLPLLPSGKVDRKALPAPSSARPELEFPFLAPRTPFEKEVAAIWAEVLGLDQVGIHDNFQELGGDSLLASRVISRVIDTRKVELPIRSLFESPTVANMTAVIIQSKAKRAEQQDIEPMLAQLEALSDERATYLLKKQIE